MRSQSGLSANPLFGLLVALVICERVCDADRHSRIRILGDNDDGDNDDLVIVW